MGSLSASMGPAARTLAASLAEAAEALAGARDPDAFRTALDATHHAWRRVDLLARTAGWAFASRHTQFALAATARGRAITDAEVEALIRIGREAAAALAPAMPLAWVEDAPQALVTFG